MLSHSFGYILLEKYEISLFGGYTSLRVLNFVRNSGNAGPEDPMVTSPFATKT